MIWFLRAQRAKTMGEQEREETMGFTIFDPTDGPPAKAFALARRLSSLTGKTVGILDNGKAKSDRLLQEVQALLRQEAGVADFVVVRKPSAFRPAPDDQLDDLARRTHAVVTGIGD
jgi:hypothetical protein